LKEKNSRIDNQIVHFTKLALRLHTVNTLVILMINLTFLNLLVFSLRQCCIIQFDCTPEKPMLPEVRRTFVHDVDTAEVQFFTYKAKATNVVLESKAKDSRQGHIAQGQDQTITRPRPQILSLSLRSRTNITGLNRICITTKSSFKSHHHHHIRFWYLWCCGCPGLRGRQHLATPHTRSP